MKNKILGLALLASATMLTSCMDPEQNSNDALLQNALVLTTANTGSLGVGNEVTFDETVIPGFTIGSTTVSIAYSVGTNFAALQAAGTCNLLGADQSMLTGTTYNGLSSTSTENGLSFLGGLSCNANGSGDVISVDESITFTVNGNTYSATTNLSVTR